MKYYPLTSSEAPAESLRSEYESGRKIGKIRLGSNFLFFKSGLRTYYVPYKDIHRYFRRVMLVPARLCCGKMNLEVEHLVLCDKTKELAQIQLPGTKAAKVLMDSLATLMPDAVVGYPKKRKEMANV